VTVTYIAVEGVIGVGKTTLARLLQPEFGAELLLEAFEENPFLGDFYRDRSRYAFQTQIFFLLSRYRQQQALAKLLETGSVLSDYVFGKDRLFAQENLAGDELATYEQLYAALSPSVPDADLVVYLYAETDVLMDRIAVRDRSIERSMSRDYIELLRVAYERFFGSYDESPVVRIDCSELDFVRKPADLALVSDRIRSVLREGIHQRSLFELAERRASTAGRAKQDGSERLSLRGAPQRGDKAAALYELAAMVQALGAVSDAVLQVQARPDQDDRGAAAPADVEARLEACSAALARLAVAMGLQRETADRQQPGEGTP